MQLDEKLCTFDCLDKWESLSDCSSFQGTRTFRLSRGVVSKILKLGQGGRKEFDKLESFFGILKSKILKFDFV